MHGTLAERIDKPRFAGTISSVATKLSLDAREEQLLELSKALANPTRLAILRWLGDPEANFAPQAEPAEEVGVCVKQIQEKAGISQSTASQFMGILQRAGLVSSHRVGRWTYYKRESERVEELSALLRDGL